ncbi:MAG: hypothetical protein QM820_46090 [Minicystis sp.]
MTKTLAGFKSRCTIPRRCASARAAQILESIDGRLVDRERPALAQQPFEIGPHESLHDHVGRAVVELPHVEDAHHVIALELGHGARLAEEALLRPVGPGRVGPEDLDGAGLQELEVPREHDDPAAAGGEDPLHGVLASEDVSDPDESIHDCPAQREKLPTTIERGNARRPQ